MTPESGVLALCFRVIHLHSSTKVPDTEESLRKFTKVYWKFSIESLLLGYLAHARHLEQLARVGRPACTVMASKKRTLLKASSAALCPCAH
jgi:hypothetical protein